MNIKRHKNKCDIITRFKVISGPAESASLGGETRVPGNGTITDYKCLKVDI